MIVSRSRTIAPTRADSASPEVFCRRASRTSRAFSPQPSRDAREVIVPSAFAASHSGCCAITARRYA